jgi:hypothetical protein
VTSNLDMAYANVNSSYQPSGMHRATDPVKAIESVGTNKQEEPTPRAWDDIDQNISPSEILDLRNSRASAALEGAHAPTERGTAAAAHNVETMEWWLKAKNGDADTLAEAVRVLTIEHPGTSAKRLVSEVHARFPKLVISLKYQGIKVGATEVREAISEIAGTTSEIHTRSPVEEEEFRRRRRIASNTDTKPSSSVSSGAAQDVTDVSRLMRPRRSSMFGKMASRGDATPPSHQPRPAKKAALFRNKTTELGKNTHTRRNSEDEPTSPHLLSPQKEMDNLEHSALWGELE